MTDVGTVYLIGASPGDPGLITVRGCALLARASVVLYDRLIGDELLQLTRPDAKLIYVGKSAHDHTLSQQEINDLLVEKARAGLDVARLKDGDPFVFGRGGEEAEVLSAAGVPFEVVPGISSAIAVPTYAGIPVTHRDLASSVAVVTGHRGMGGNKGDEGQSLDWDALAQVDTLVVLMGVGNLSTITEKLLAAGRNPEIPAAVIRWGTTPLQRTVTGTLATIAPLTREEGLLPPAVLVVGGVVNLQPKLSWFETRPLFGLRVLVTRPAEEATQTAARLRALGAEPILFPTIAIQPLEDWSSLDAALERLAGHYYDWLILTSVNAVRFVWEHLRAAGRDARALAETRLATIGPITCRALAKRGLQADLVPEQYVTEATLERIGPVDGLRILAPRADIARPALVAGLETAGATVDEVTVYLTVRASSDDAGQVREMLTAGAIDVLTFTSSSTVLNFVAALEPLPSLRTATIVACIGPITARTAIEAGLRVDVSAEEHTMDGLLYALVEHLEETRRD